MDITKPLQVIVGDRVKENEPMAKHTNFKLGGEARWYVEARTIEEVQKVVALAQESGVRFVVHGGGSNSLFADAGFDGLVLVPALRHVDIDGTTVRCGAGALSVMVARTTAEAGLKGLGWMISLPGTIGGAVRGNAGCFGGETKDHLVSAKVLRPVEDGWEVADVSPEDLAFAYRHSAIKTPVGKDWIVLEAQFELERGDVETLRYQLAQHIESRKSSQPLNAGSAGCMFKNVDVTDRELDRLSHLRIPDEMRKSHRLSAGWVIDQLGLKGKAIGGASVSEVHGNFIVNDGTATADHVMQLIAFIKTRARDELGLRLEEEVQFIQ